MSRGFLYDISTIAVRVAAMFLLLSEWYLMTKKLIAM